MVEQKALWSGRFEGDMDNSTLEFTSSLDVDSTLAFYDAMGSLAHVRMLKKCKIIPADDADLIIKGLIDIVDIMENGELELDESLEDIHTNLEFMLTNKIGAAGGKLHTGRSRNDQVATDFKMYLRDVTLEVAENIDSMIMSLLKLAEDHGNTILPGFTHLQHAQPVTLAHHMLAHAFRFSRDCERFLDAYYRMNKCPLGAAALAGTTYPIDRKMTSDLLGFDAPTENSMDTVGSRDFVAELAFCSAMLSVNLSSICEELIMWSSPEFGFVEMDDKYSTGSSIMPQKKNPDITELIRGRTGSVMGGLVGMMMTMKGLPLSYNRDLQEDKRQVMDSLQIVNECTKMMSRVVSTMMINKDRMLDATENGFINATDLADYLVTKGIAFRAAHGIVGEAVRYCIDNELKLEEVTLEQFKKFDPAIEEDVYEFLPVLSCVERRCSYGGPAAASTDAQLSDAIAALMAREDIIRQNTMLIEGCWNKLLSIDE